MNKLWIGKLYAGLRFFLVVVVFTGKIKEELEAVRNSAMVSD